MSSTLRRNYNEVDVDCHCGLAFGDTLPEEYAPKEAFYLGFDCGHICDGVDSELAYKYGLINEHERDKAIKSFLYLDGQPVRSLDYVVNECKKIADQLEELEK